MQMLEFLSLVAHILVSPFKTRARLQAEIIVLRHQVNVLRRRLPAKPRLTVTDRLISVCLYWLFPSLPRPVTYALCDGDRGAIGRSRMAVARRRRAKTGPY